MRTLKFVVENQIIKLDPSCDFDGIVPGTENYLKAEFTFSPEWRGAAKVATFWSAMGREYPPMVLEDGKSCMIPEEALAKRIFKVQVLGKKNGQRLITNKVEVNQNGGAV